MIALSTLLPSLVIELPGCTTTMITQQLHRFVREFCRETGVWHEDLSAITSVAEQEDYTLTSEYASAVIHRVSSVAVGWLNDNGNLDNDDWSVDLRDATLTIDPAPADDGEDIIPHVVYLPLMANTELPDWVMNEYEDVIIWGLLTQMLNMDGERWANPNRAKWYGEKYRGHLEDLATDEIIQGQVGDLVMSTGIIL